MTLEQFNNRYEDLTKIPQCRLNADQLIFSDTLQRTIINAGFDLQKKRTRHNKLNLSDETKEIADPNRPGDFVLLAMLHWIEHGLIIREKSWRSM